MNMQIIKILKKKWITCYNCGYHIKQNLKKTTGNTDLFQIKQNEHVTLCFNVIHPLQLSFSYQPKIQAPVISGI